MVRIAERFDPTLTMGVEEEYLMVDPKTWDLARDPPKSIMTDCEKELGAHVTTEFLRSQIEIGTPVCHSVAEARASLQQMRQCVIGVVESHDLALIAASTHPFAHWDTQLHTPKERYDDLARDMQGAAKRMLICGMHVHCGIEDPDLRIDLMNQVSYFLPHLLALSTSSPFWHGKNMGMRSYRLSVFDGMPRTGMPDRFNSMNDFERFVARMVEAGALKDGTKLWWDIRPSARFPTLEMRITDVCPRLDDAVALAALYQALLRMLVRLRRINQRWRIYPRTMLMENRWLAQRHGISGTLIDLGQGRCLPFPQLIREILDLVKEDAEALGSTEELARIENILANGTSADRQLETFFAAKEGGADDQEALGRVVEHLRDETRSGIFPPDGAS